MERPAKAKCLMCYLCKISGTTIPHKHLVHTCWHPLHPKPTHCQLKLPAPVCRYCTHTSSQCISTLWIQPLNMSSGLALGTSLWPTQPFWSFTKGKNSTKFSGSCTPTKKSVAGRFVVFLNMCNTWSGVKGCFSRAMVLQYKEKIKMKCAFEMCILLKGNWTSHLAEAHDDTTCRMKTCCVLGWESMATEGNHLVEFSFFLSCIFDVLSIISALTIVTTVLVVTVVVRTVPYPNYLVLILCYTLARMLLQCCNVSKQSAHLQILRSQCHGFESFACHCLGLNIFRPAR